MTTLTHDDLKSLVKTGMVRKMLFSFPSLRLLTYRLEFILYPLWTAVLIRLLSRGSCFIEDEDGKIIKINISSISKIIWIWFKDFISVRRRIEKCKKFLSEFHEAAVISNGQISIESASVVYLRTDMWFGIKAGGSVGHVAGVVNNFENLGLCPLLLTSDYLKMISPSIETHIIKPRNQFWNFPDILPLDYDSWFVQNAQTILKGRSLSFIYQRYSHNNMSGVLIARRLNKPLVLEFNGSESWVRKNWGWGSLRHIDLTNRIEEINLKSASLVVVVSRVLEKELVDRGISPSRILFNPNGVDADQFHPAIDGTRFRAQYSLSGKFVIGFLGTFGPWHGAEVLAQAACLLLSHQPELLNRVHFLFMGTGQNKRIAEDIIVAAGRQMNCTFTGRIDQEKAPEGLAACDILVSPHVPNPDGSPFFGSPTKLFEYMAMGKPIIASRLEQIGEILEHEKSAYLVKPDDSEALALSMAYLIENPALAKKLGVNAREAVLGHYTWKQHTQRIVKKLTYLNAERLAEKC
jgi:glycosyltransferase involved in cell wall biosynthesis